MKELVFNFDTDGNIETIYGEELTLSELGKLNITRASHVEPNAEGKWTVDMSPMDSEKFGNYDKRTDALNAEVEWLKKNHFQIGV